ncbi:MAG: universal stress protein [Brevundimonas sp.]
MSKILACIDASPYGASVCDHAAWAARLLGAQLDLLHVLDRAPDAPPTDVSGSIGLGASEHLLEQLTQLDADRGRLRMDRGRALLAEAERRVRDAGVSEVEVRLRHGGLVDTVHEMESEFRLVVLGKRGEHVDFAKAHLGGSVEQVVRASALPVLMATRAFKPVERILLAFDGGPSARKAVDFLISEPRLHAFDCHVVMAGRPRDAQVHLDWLSERFSAWGGAHTVRQIEGEPEAVITDYVAANAIDLLIMGAYGHSPIRRFIVGSTTTAMIRIALLPVLLFR